MKSCPVTEVKLNAYRCSPKKKAVLGVRVAEGGALLHPSWHLLFSAGHRQRGNMKRTGLEGDLREAPESASGVDAIPAMQGKAEVASPCLKGRPLGRSDPRLLLFSQGWWQ